MTRAAKLTPSIAIVHAPTRLEGLKRRWGTVDQARFLLRHARQHEVMRRAPSARLSPRLFDDVEKAALPAAARQAAFSEYESEDAVYRDALDRLEREELPFDLPVRRVERSFLPNYDFSNCAVVIVVGQDGLVANTAKYVGELPIVAVNPDPARIDGVLLPFGLHQVQRAVRSVLLGQHRVRQVTLAEVNLNDGQRLLAFNDFFVGANSHVSARYVLESPAGAEPQSSSGIIVSTGAGSTGWMSSVFNMSAGVDRLLGSQPQQPPTMSWDDRRLLWAVREPFVSKRSRASQVAGWLEESQSLVVESMMPEGGVIFSDGIEADFLAFNSGTIARIGVSPQRAQLVV